MYGLEYKKAEKKKKFLALRRTDFALYPLTYVCASWRTKCILHGVVIFCASWRTKVPHLAPGTFAHLGAQNLGIWRTNSSALSAQIRWKAITYPPPWLTFFFLRTTPTKRSASWRTLHSVVQFLRPNTRYGIEPGAQSRKMVRQMRNKIQVTKKTKKQRKEISYNLCAVVRKWN